MRQTVQVVNKGFEGEPVIHALQNRETLEIFDLERIRFTEYVDGNRREANPEEDINLVISTKPNHTCEIEVDENGFVTLFL